MTTSEIMAALRAKYKQPEYALFFEVRNQTGFDGITRIADAIAMNMYPSKGLHIHGFEIKTSRADLMNDLKNPEKHIEIARHCNFWWLVVGDRAIIKDGEIPESWGLMVPRGDKLAISKHAPLREHDGLPMGFVASLLRSAMNASPGEAEINEVIKRALVVEREHIKNNNSYEIETLQRTNGILKKKITDFEESSGVRFTAFDGKKIGEAVKFVLTGGVEGARAKMKNIAVTAKKISEMADISIINSAEQERI